MISIFKWGEGSHASKMPLGDGFKSLEEGAESNNNTVSTPTNEMDVEADNGSLLQIWFVEGGGKEIFGRAVAEGSRFCIFLWHDL